MVLSMLIMPAPTFSRKKFLSAWFQRAEVSFERPGLFDIVRYEREGGERRLLVVGRCGVLSFDLCRVFSQDSLMRNNCVIRVRELLCVYVWVTFC